MKKDGIDVNMMWTGNWSWHELKVEQGEKIGSEGANRWKGNPFTQACLVSALEQCFLNPLNWKRPWRRPFDIFINHGYIMPDGHWDLGKQPWWRAPFPLVVLTCVGSWKDNTICKRWSDLIYSVRETERRGRLMIFASRCWKIRWRERMEHPAKKARS